MSAEPVSPGDIDQFRQRVVGRRIAESTANQYQTWIERFEMWRPGGSPDLGMLIDFDTLLADDGRTDYPWEQTRGPAPPNEYAHSSRKLVMSALKLWLRLQYGVDIIEQPQNIVSGEPEPFDPHYLSHDDIQRAYDAAHGACDCIGCEAAMRLTYDAILRASELVLLSPRDIDLDAGTVDVTATKGSLNASIGLADSTVRALRRHLQSDAWTDDSLFLNTYGRGWSANAWAMHFRRKHHEAGAHSFGRHSPIVHRLQSDEFDFGDVYRRARHVSPSMTARYARVVDADIPDWGQDT